MANRPVSENFTMRIAHPVRARGVAMVDRALGRFTYLGTAGALIAAGLVRREWLPGDPACPNKTTLVTRVDGRRVNIRRAPGRKFEVRFGETEAERESLRAQQRDWSTAGEYAEIGELELAGEAQENANDEDGWPPALDHQTEIKLGDGSRYHFLGSADAIERAGLLDADEIPGNPACKYRWWFLGWHDGKCFFATRLGHQIAVTLLRTGEGQSSIIRCLPLKLSKRGTADDGGR